MGSAPEPVKLETGDIIKAVVISQSGKLEAADLKKWGMNLLLFVAPTFALFFGLLAQGVDIKDAWPVAAFGFYQALSDLITKWRSEKLAPNQ
jgi:hypothetical protein